MNLTVNSHGVGNATVTAVQLRPIIGALECVVLLALTVVEVKTIPRWLRIESARAALRSSSGSEQSIGTLRPNQIFQLDQDGGAFPRTVELSAVLQRRQLVELEDLRAGGDLGLKLTLLGIGGEARNRMTETPFNAEIHCQIHQSEWVRQLNAARAAGIILMEASLPVVAGPSDEEGIADLLLKAERAFHNGSYADCVGACRLVYDRLGLKARPKVPEKLEMMTFVDRVAMVIASVRHTTHLPHHTEPNEVEHDYTRDEARLIFQTTAAATSYWLTK